MTREKPFPRRRPAAADQTPRNPANSGSTDDEPQHSAMPVRPAAPDSLDVATLLRAHLNASMAQATSETVGSSSVTVGLRPEWRTQLAELGEAAGLGEEQQAAFERLARAQQERVRVEVERLLAEIKPHLNTPEWDDALRRYEAGLIAMKGTLDAETSAMLESFGLERPTD